MIKHNTQISLVTVILFYCLATGNSCTSAKKLNAALPAMGTHWQLSLPGNTKLDMQWIAAGEFDMGSPATEEGRKPDESPLTHVTISKGYWLGKTELTIGQWKSVMGETLRGHVMAMLKDETIYDFGGQQKTLRAFMNFDPTDPDRVMANENDSLPMYFASWDDAMAFCRRLTQLEKDGGRLPNGYEYSLPTEAQWEYACRAGTTTATFDGPLMMTGRTSAVVNDIAWYGGNNTVNYTGKKLGNTGAGPRKVAEKKPNGWGLYDMPGNIWEWCRDWYGAYPGGNITDPTGPNTGTARVNRGGSWGSGAADERSANRAKNPQPEKSAWRGFRVALCAVN
jgi:formylglycine-generating enzyme